MKLTDSCQVAFGKNSLIGQFTAGCIVGAVMLVGALIKHLWRNEFVWDFIDGFCPTFGGIAVIFFTIFMIGGAFSMVTAAPGFKYFRSLANGDEHFRNCLITANLAGSFCLGLYALIGSLFYDTYQWHYFIFTGLLCMGLQNLMGGARLVWVKFVSLVGFGFVFGFIRGSLDDHEDRIPLFVTVILACACAAFYIVSAVIALYRVKKLWRREA